MPDAIALLKDSRPDAAYEPDVDALERILAAPAPARRRRSTRPRRALAVAGTAAAIAVVVTPLLDDSPDVLARAAAALDDSDSILHFTATWRQGQAHGSMEVWRADGGRTERTLWAGGESVENAETHTGLYYDRERNQIRRVTPEDLTRTHELPAGVEKLEGSVTISPWFTAADDFETLLDQARSGDANVHELPDTTVRGIPVHQLAIRVAESPIETERIVSVDRETYLPVRVEARISGTSFVTDYVDAERLPRTEANENLLKMAPHPGAEEVG
jgi:hypothetical protein